MKLRTVFAALACCGFAAAVLALSAANRLRADIAPPAPPPQGSAVHFQRTSARLARGKYLAEYVIGCFRCHSPRDWNSPGAPPVSGKKGAGYFFVKGAGPVDPHKPPPPVIAPNITPDPDTGIGRWSDDVLARAIRESVTPDGRVFPSSFHVGPHNLSDEDLAALVVYLRTIPPVRNPEAATTMPLFQSAEAAQQVAPRSVPEPDLSDLVHRGEYVVSLADCVSCHTTDVAKSPLHDQKFAGGKLLSDSPDHYVVTPNITFDPSGIGYYNEATFVHALRKGSVGTRKLYAIMPWGYFRHLSDEDLKAIFAFLKTLPHVQHKVDNAEPPTPCRLCLQRHGYGDRN